mgnify:CR=1 FL=1
MPETTEQEVPVEDQGQAPEPTGATYPAPPVDNTTTTFSHEVTSADPGAYVFDPVHEAEMLREIIRGVEIRARDFSAKLKAFEGEIYDKGEVIANSILAIRHIEDARMRFGKCIQYTPVSKQGVSSYQK